METRMGVINRIFRLIKESSYDKKGGKISSGRLSSYFVLAVIIGAALTFIGIDVANAIVAITNKGFYEIPTNHIILYGMTLAHHLTLLGINKNSETKIEQAIQDKMKSVNKLKNETSEFEYPEEDV
jgi:hypothetical protein